MSLLAQAARDLTDTLTSWGIDATATPETLAVPGALIAPDTITTSMGGALSITWDIYLIAPDNGTPLTPLGDLLDRVREHITTTTVDAATLTVANHSPDPLPALHFTLTTETAP